MRSHCIGKLFQRSFAYTYRLGKADAIPPPSVWPYIRSLTLYEQLKNPLLSPVLYIPSKGHEDVLFHAMNSMPQLRRVVVNETHGVPWPILAVLISVSHLREFELRGQLFNSRERSPRNPTSGSAPLASFRYIPDLLRPPPRSCPSEKRVLAIVLERLCTSLENVVLPSESAPFRAMNQWDWSRLRQLSIEGDARRAFRTREPLISVLSNMRGLRTLALKLAYSPEQRLQAIWPQDFEEGSLPWPDLESLTITWAYPQDRLFDHLPASLRHLSLRCWPRLHAYYIQHRKSVRNDVPWPERALPWRDLLDVLRRCRGAALERLELEYEVDTRDSDLELLQFIPHAFPCLRTLQIHRYRCYGNTSSVPLEAIIDALRPLAHLNVLRLFLDFELLAHWQRDRLYVSDEEIWEPVDATIEIVIRKAGPSLRYLCLLPSVTKPVRWDVYRLERSANGGVHAHLEDSLDTVGGYSNNSDD
ncbi:hypothetical protein OH77DRAFT_1430989 [Trametes cingulata]|nr:hypothetical protein OH77DRAFT_1430989 [Trametes cingulata]